MSASSAVSRPSINRQFVLAVRPTGMPDHTTFNLIESPIRELKDGELLVRAMYFSVDPYMRGRLSTNRSYAAPVEVGGIMVGAAVARIVESKNPGFAVDDIVLTSGPKALIEDEVQP